MFELPPPGPIPGPSTFITVDEIFRRLDLEDPDEFAIRRMRENLSLDRVRQAGTRLAIESVYRRTGRTTRAIIGGIARAAPDGVLTICGGVSASIRHLHAQHAREICHRLGLPIEIRVRNGPVPEYGLEPGPYVRDHSDTPEPYWRW